MPWIWTENMKISVCMYVLQRCIGRFLEDKLTSDQLKVELFKGTACVYNVTLDAQVC
jgi:hypothetical protein